MHTCAYHSFGCLALLLVTFMVIKTHAFLQLQRYIICHASLSCNFQKLELKIIDKIAKIITKFSDSQRNRPVSLCVSAFVLPFVISTNAVLSFLEYDNIHTVFIYHMLLLVFNVIVIIIIIIIITIIIICIIIIIICIIMIIIIQMLK